MKNFKTYDLAKELYTKVKNVKLPHYSKNQILRASLSVCLNLSEGNERPTIKDKRRFFYMALTSHREMQSLLEIEELYHLAKRADILGAHLYRLCHSQQITIRPK